MEVLVLILFCPEGALPDALWMFVTLIFLGLVLKYVCLSVLMATEMQTFQHLKPPNLEVSKIYPKRS